MLTNKVFIGMAAVFFILAGFYFLFFSSPASASTLLTSPGPGGGPHVRAFSADGTVQAEPDKLMAYAESYRGGTRVATGDIDNDGIDEIITGTGENGGPHLRVFEKDGTQRGIEFFPFHPDFRGGMDVASGDFDGDGKDDIAVTQFSKGECWAKVYKYNDQRTVLFYQGQLYGRGIESGCTVAMGNVDNDSNDELIVGAGTGGGPHVRVYDYNSTNTGGTLKPISFFAFHPDSRTGIDVAAGDVDNDGKDEIAASQLRNGQAWVKVYRYNNAQSVVTTLNAYNSSAVGANVDLYDIDNDNAAEIITAPGVGGGPQIRAFETDGSSIDTTNFFAYDSKFRGGADVTGFNDDPLEYGTYLICEQWQGLCDYETGIKNIKSFGGSVVLIPVNNLYPSKYLPQVDWVSDNHIQNLVDYAHSQNMKIYAWMGMPHSYWLERHPEWIARTSDGLPTNNDSDYYFYVNVPPSIVISSSEYKSFLKGQIGELIDLGFDGIDINDDVQFLNDASFDDISTDKFERDTGIEVPGSTVAERASYIKSDKNRFDRWYSWRADQLTELLGFLQQSVYDHDSNIPIRPHLMNGPYSYWDWGYDLEGIADAVQAPYAMLGFGEAEIAQSVGSLYDAGARNIPTSLYLSNLEEGQGAEFLGSNIKAVRDAGGTQIFFFTYLNAHENNLWSMIGEAIEYSRD